MGRTRERGASPPAAPDAQARAGDGGGDAPDLGDARHARAGSDAPGFAPLLYDAWRRASVRTVVADAGYDSEGNHRFARLDLGVTSVIPPRVGRPGAGPPAGYYRRLMKKRFKRKADAKAYGQRSQSETANSMLKRNLGDELRSIDPTRQKQELMLRAIVHNLMLPPPESEGRD